MFFTQQLLVNFSSFALCTMFILVAVVFAVCGLFVSRKIMPHYKLKLHNDVAGPLFSTVGVVYAVLLAFMVILVWGDFDKANINVEREAIRLVNLYRDSQAFGPELRNPARALFKEYAGLIINEEWKMLPFSQSSPKVSAAINQMFSLYSGYLPKNLTEQAFFTESVRNLNELVDLRMSRLIQTRTGVHPLLWFILIIGGMVTITFTFFFGSENFSSQIVMSVLLSILIALILFTILALDFPFGGSISISPNAFRQIAAL